MKAFAKHRRLVSLMMAVLLSFPVKGIGAELKTRVSVAVGGIAVGPEDIDREQAMRLALIRAFGQVEGVKLIPAEEIGKWRRRFDDGPVDKPSERALDEARALLADGKRAYGQLAFAEAYERLNGAREQFIRNLSVLRSNRDLIDTHVYLGVTLVSLDEEDRAKEFFKRVVYLDPKWDLSAREFSPKVRAVFARARQEVEALETIRLKVESEPAGAAVYLNGRNRGDTPLALDLKQGEYFILLDRRGRKSSSSMVSLRNRLETVNVRMEPDPGDVAWLSLFGVREGDRQRLAHAREVADLAASVGADFVFLSDVRRDPDMRVFGQLFDSRTAEFSRVAVASVGENLRAFPSVAADLVATVMGFVRPDGYLSPEARPAGALPESGLTVGAADRPIKEAVETSTPPQKMWYERWWVWPIIGGAAVGIFFGVRRLGAGGGGAVIEVNNKGNF